MIRVCRARRISQSEPGPLYSRQYGSMAAMVKMTFTVDEQTVDLLRRMAARLKKPQSVVFREAIRDYSERVDRLRHEEREHMLAVVDRMMARKATRPQAEVDAELRQIRAARRTGGRRTRVE